MRHGRLWIARRSDGAMLVERRPDRGLLGGMLGFVGSDWDGAGGTEPLDLPWRTIGEVRHTFTHFHLILSLEVAEAPQDAHPRRGHFLRREEYRPADLPTVMRKAHDLTSQVFSSL